jgi:D-beta-D-heptose 7-phosphate kinase/D-beta-D-heptose 1-phosphate adenosyltransferase
LPDTATLQVGTGERHYSVAAAKSVWNYVRELGGEPTLVSIIGEDQTGEQIRAGVAGLPIHLIAIPSRPSTRKIRYWCHGAALLDVVTASHQPLAAAAAEAVWREIENHLSTTDVVIAADFSYGLFNPWLIERVCGLEKLGIPVVADVQCSTNYGSILRYRNISLTKPNEREARHSAMDFHSPLDELGERMLQESGNRHLVISRGAKGMRIYSQERNAGAREDIPRPANLPSLATVVADPTGAGDSALAMFALALAADVPILDAAFLASAAAAQVVARRGDDNPISRVALEQQIQQWLRE